VAPGGRPGRRTRSFSLASTRRSGMVRRMSAGPSMLGVPRPSSTPIFYCVSTSRLITAPVIEVSGDRSSGEVEFILVQTGRRLYVGVGSDHTDRAARKSLRRSCSMAHPSANSISTTSNGARWRSNSCSLKRWKTRHGSRHAIRRYGRGLSAHCARPPRIRPGRGNFCCAPR
jgi:hypothetical protein